MCSQIVLQMYKDQWTPDYIVGITRGGNVPATIITHMTKSRCEALKVSLRDDGNCESNLWMAEDAANGVNILIVDDINDSGATLNWIKQDWEGSVASDIQWNKNVRFAVLTENMSSTFNDVDYYASTVNKAEDDVWLVFPWEVVGKYE
jgi:xanthine phosphoribosyltransferase